MVSGSKMHIENELLATKTASVKNREKYKNINNVNNNKNILFLCFLCSGLEYGEIS